MVTVIQHSHSFNTLTPFHKSPKRKLSCIEKWWGVWELIEPDGEWTSVWSSGSGLNWMRWQLRWVDWQTELITGSLHNTPAMFLPAVWPLYTFQFDGFFWGDCIKFYQNFFVYSLGEFSQKGKWQNIRMSKVLGCNFESLWAFLNFSVL